MAEQSIGRRAVVRGRVQGVFFRASTREQALRAGVTGSVRNRDDGAVEAVFEGSPEAVERMLAWIREGPPGASVERVEISEHAPRGASELVIV